MRVNQSNEVNQEESFRSRVHELEYLTALYPKARLEEGQPQPMTPEFANLFRPGTTIDQDTTSAGKHYLEQATWRESMERARCQDISSQVSPSKVPSFYENWTLEGTWPEDPNGENQCEV